MQYSITSMHTLYYMYRCYLYGLVSNLFSSPSSATRKSFGSFSDEATDAVPNVKAAFTYQKLESTTTTDDSDDWHFNQPNVFLDDNNDNTGAQRKTVDTTPAPHLDDDAPWYEVVSRFLCRHDDEIDLNVGDKIAVTAKYPDLWFQGTNLVTGKQGIFPSLYVKEIPKEIPKAEKEIPKAERDLLVSLDQDVPPVPKRLGSLNKQMTEPILPLTKSEEMKMILEMPDETQSMPPRLTKPPVITRVKSPQRSIRAGWMSLDDDNDSPAALSAGLDNPGYIGNGTKKDNSPDSTKATSVSPTSPAVVGTSDVVAKPSIKSRSFIVDDTESDYSEVLVYVVIEYNNLSELRNFKFQIKNYFIMWAWFVYQLLGYSVFSEKALWLVFIKESFTCYMIDQSHACIHYMAEDLQWKSNSF